MLLPYHPPSKGLAERFVQTFKCSMKAGEKVGTLSTFILPWFHFDYRCTPAHTTPNLSLSKLFLQIKSRFRFDLLIPDTQGFVTSPSIPEDTHGKHSKLRSMLPEQFVIVRDFCPHNTRIPGAIVKKPGPVTYNAEVEESKILKTLRSTKRWTEPTCSIFAKG